jgi:hypothetical protein
MKKSKLALALTVAAFTSTVMASSLHNHPEGTVCPLHGDSFITPEGIAAKEAAKTRLSQMSKSLRLSEQALSATMESPAVIDVAVLLHASYIESLKEQLTTDLNGRFFENGAQFAVARTKAQYDYYNESLRQQNVPVVLRPVYFSLINTGLSDDATATEVQEESAKIINCVMNEKWIEINNGNEDYCTESKLFDLNDKLRTDVDTAHLVMARKAGVVRGLGGFFNSITVFDDYADYIKLVVNPNPDTYTDADLESLRFGHFGAGVVTHEFGHVFGAMHEVSTSEPEDSKDNRAYACGQPDARAVRPSDDKKKFTAMWASGGSLTDTPHRVYSAPELVIDGDACGIEGEANNLRSVKENAPLVAAKQDLRPALSNLVFEMDSYEITRTDSVLAIVLRRTGDLAQPVELSITAKDGTAWEGRDFEFGLQEVAFAAGESEKTVEVTLLPRAERHADTEFSLQINGAIGATYPAQGPVIRIVSENPLSLGTVQFAAATNATTEGDTAQLTVSRQDGQDGDIEFTVTAADGSAQGGTDYSFTTQVITIASGETQAVVEVPTAARAGKQGPRTVNLSISAVSDGATLGAVAQTSLTINDKAESGTLAFGSATSSVMEGGTVNLTIQRTAGTDGAVSVRVRTANGVAVAGTDFTALDQVVSLAEGQASVSVAISTLSRSGAQGARHFDVQLSDATGGAQIGGFTSTRITISDTTSTGGSEDSGSGGGSMSWWMLFAVGALIRLRRR